jgi:hypothetical protein
LGDGQVEILAVRIFFFWKGKDLNLGVAWEQVLNELFKIK